MVGVRFVLLILPLLSGCPGGMIVADKHQPSDGGEGSLSGEQKKTGDRSARGVDLPVTPGVPCLSGACGPNLICMANICLKTCTQPGGVCNEKVATCGAEEACMFASSFTDACYPARADVNDPCDFETAVYCRQGTLCIKLAIGNRCLKLCKYGCPSGTTCMQTDKGNCQICVPF